MGMLEHQNTQNRQGQWIPNNHSQVMQTQMMGNTNSVNNINQMSNQGPVPEMAEGFPPMNNMMQQQPSNLSTQSNSNFSMGMNNMQGNNMNINQFNNMNSMNQHMNMQGQNQNQNQSQP